MGGARYTIHTVPHSNWPWNMSSNVRGTVGSLNPSSQTNYQSRTIVPGSATRFRGRQLLDHEALSCLLILLFVDEPKLNIIRLHRVLRNLCHHVPTRQWVVQSLLAIMERTREAKDFIESSKPKKGANTTPNHR